MPARFAYLLSIIVLLAGTASAAAITSVTEGALHNGQPVDPESLTETPLEIAIGDTVDGPATIETAAGDTVSVDPGSQVQLVAPLPGEAEQKEGLELFFVKRGSARGKIGTKTEIACSIGWLSAPTEGSPVQFYVEEIEKGRAFYRSNEGNALLVHNPDPENPDVPTYLIRLLEGNGIEINVPADREKKGDLGFETQQGNPADVHIRALVTSSLAIDLDIPKATSGTIEQDGPKTKLSSAATSFKGGKIIVGTEIDSEEMQSGELGPGTFAFIDNVTGAFSVPFVEINFEIVKRDISLTSEFSTIAVSNFSSLKK